ncbi:prolipoprotein diacylglyceryl transferase [Teredinibacter turnerae]|uniref:Phosphatidylglycerol--prolipoprotein diacylglyceryl transferase n=1 Tax=Teredinibacter turnerae (strain ATCC 39867 / T7901) TaxID=377629 RepID=LGT_TERTT|nr:prolipoprotein diacylglyceryl transferase [Teredinibacter turnerae]C5BMA2.1 RecName: Full=Phosphatidylglycerol--prolipoprotein diacylglyceryl transferase [Teredinibacter turnerae T7901]ACR12474.1 prolipoprotein diacylglyceryl transferase [Teredinibacter turnerae T7901]
MLKYPEIDPVALSLGSVTVFGKTINLPDIHWYGLMYLFGFILCWAVGTYRAGKPHNVVHKSWLEDLVFYVAMGVVLGGRCGYVFFYNFGAFLDDPLWLFRVWEGGMSFHGGLLGVILAMMLYARKMQVRFLDLMDFVAPLVPIGLGLGRIGNFIGQELWGRVTTLPIGMVFPKDPGVARHPSQLYQAALEGLVLFAVLFWFSSKPRPRAAVASLFLILYGCFRFAVEFVREPDAHIGFDMFGWLTRGQELSLPMIIIGALIFFYAYRHPAYAEKAPDPRANGSKKG